MFKSPEPVATIWSPISGSKMILTLALGVTRKFKSKSNPVKSVLLSLKDLEILSLRKLTKSKSSSISEIPYIGKLIRVPSRVSTSSVIDMLFAYPEILAVPRPYAFP